VKFRDTRARDLADFWLESGEGWPTGTERTYRSMVETQIEPALGELRVSEEGMLQLGRPTGVPVC
jgi:hypothetical protein